MKLNAETFPNRNIAPLCCCRVEVGLAPNPEAFAEPDFAHLGILVAHQNGLAQRKQCKRFEIHSAEDIWQRRKR
jgi:hypothetical protein